jgi:hypothetical protein
MAQDRPDPNPPSPPDPWCRARRLLLWLLVGVAACLLGSYGWKEWKRLREEKAHARAAAYRGRANPQDALRITDEDLALLREFGLLHHWPGALGPDGMSDDGQIEYVTLLEARITPAGLRSLAGLKGLKGLLLQRHRVTDDWLAALVEAGLVGLLERDGAAEVGGVRLIKVALEGSSVTPAGVRHLRVLKGPVWLSLGPDQATEEGLGHAAGIGPLHTLVLPGEAVPAPALRKLGGARGLSCLAVGTGQITDGLLETLGGGGLIHALTAATGAAEGPRHPLAQGPRAADDPGVVALDLRESAVTDDGLKHLSGLTGLRGLDLERTRVTPAGLAHLAGLRTLRRLGLPGPVSDAVLGALRRNRQLFLIPRRLGEEEPTSDDEIQEFSLAPFGAAITDEGLRHFAGLKALRRLDMSGWQVTDEGMSRLAALPALRSIGLRGTAVTPAGLGRLAPLKSLAGIDLDPGTVTDEALGVLRRNGQLRALSGFVRAGRSDDEIVRVSLTGTRVTDEGLPHLAGLKRLRSLELRGLAVTGGGLKSLSGLTGLKTLDLAMTAVADDGLKHLAGLDALEWLALWGTRVGDGGLKHLAGLKNLREVSVQRTNVTAEGVKKLKTALPGCAVLH